MSLEIGAVLEGKVTGITKFGAFVELPGGKTGMVHISEVAATYVKEIRDFITENQMVKVKILSVTEEGKVNLSIKRAVEQPPRRQFTPSPPRRNAPPADSDFARQTASPQTFEDMLNKFKQNSDDRMSDIKRSLDGKRGSSPRKHSK